jgi:hypothetical protein
MLHGLLSAGLVDSIYVTQTNPFQVGEYYPKIQAEAQEHGQELEVSHFSGSWTCQLNERLLVELSRVQAGG